MANNYYNSRYKPVDQNNAINLPEHLIPKAYFDGEEHVDNKNHREGKSSISDRGGYSDAANRNYMHKGQVASDINNSGQNYSSVNRAQEAQRVINPLAPRPLDNYKHSEHSVPTQPGVAPPYPVADPVVAPIETYQELQSGYGRRQMRRAPPSLPPIRSDQPPSLGRRIVSSPVTPVYASSQQFSYNSPKGNETRTKSLTNSTKNPFLHNQSHSNYLQHRMQPIPQAQSLEFTSSPQQGNNANQSSPRPNSGGNSSGSSIYHTFSLSSKSRSFSSLSKLTSLSTKKFNSSASLHGNKLDRNPSSTTLSSQKTVTASQRRPRVYPAMLSRVAQAFKDSIVLGINTKDGLEYHDTFTGKTAVDVICSLVRTNDRNLALLLGRSLDAQKFFHDVTYNHRLRDSLHEVYAFNHLFSSSDFYQEESSGNNSKHGSFVEQSLTITPNMSTHVTHSSNNNGAENAPNTPTSPAVASFGAIKGTKEDQGVNGVFTILTDCYSPTCTRNNLCYSIACPRRLEQQARLNLKPQGGLKLAVSRLSLVDGEKSKTLWHETVPPSILEKLDKKEKMRQELIYEFIYTERDYVKDLEFMTDFYVLPLRNPMNNIIPERERDAFIRTVFGGVSDLLRLAKNFSEALTRRQQLQKPVIETIGDLFLEYVTNFEPFVRYSGNKVFASFEHERQQQVNPRYARFLETIEKKPESRRQDLSSFLMKGVQRPARYQLLLNGIIKHTSPDLPDCKNLMTAKEEISKLLTKINVQTGESTDRHKVMVLHRLLGKHALEEKNHFKLSYNHRIIYQTTLNRKRDNEKIDLYLFEHALLLVKHKIQNKREQHKVFEKPIYLPLLFVSSGYEIPTVRSILNNRVNGSMISDPAIKNKLDVTSNTGSTKYPVNFLGLGNIQVHATLFAEDVANQRQVTQQIYQQQKRLIQEHDVFSLSKFETRRFHGNHKINCAVPCYGGKKLLYGTDSGVWVSTVRSISVTSNERICSDPTLVISKVYVTQMEVLVEYSKLLILSDKVLYEFDLSCTDSLDHAKNTRSGKQILNHVASFKTGVCEGKLLVCAVKWNSTGICVFEPSNPFDTKSRNKNKKYEIKEVTFSSTPISISFLKTHLCIGCTKGFEIVSLEKGKKEPILDEADPSLDFATQKESVTPLSIHRLDKKILLSYSEFSFFINGNGWRIKHDWSIYWEGNPQNIALFYPYLLAFEPGFIEVRDVESTTLIRALVGENIRFLHSNEHEALFACEENGYDIIVSIDFLNLKQKKTK